MFFHCFPVIADFTFQFRISVFFQFAEDVFFHPVINIVGESFQGPVRIRQIKLIMIGVRAGFFRFPAGSDSFLQGKIS